MRALLPWILLSLVLTTGCGLRDKRRPGIPPKHVVLITVEGLRADHTSAYLYPRDTTNFALDGNAHALGRALTLDHLAESGVLFRHASALSGNPDHSLASILLGARPLEVNGALELGGDLSERATLAKRFSEAGFLCAGFASRPRDPLPEAWTDGFEIFEERPTDLAALGAAITFGADHDWGTGRGLFLWLHLSSPAWPYEPPSFPNNFLNQDIDYSSLFTGDSYRGSLPDSALADSPVPQGERLGEGEKQRLVNLYDGEVAFTNYVMWYALDLLRYFSETEASLVDAVICVAGVSGQRIGADRAEDWGRPGLTDASLGVPLLLRHPRSLTGRRVLEPNVTLEDVGPTLLDWFQLDGLEEWRGRSLLGLTDRKPRTEFKPGPSCAFDAGSGLVTARGGVWRLTVPIDALGAAGDPFPEGAELAPVQSLRHLPDAPKPGVAEELLEALRTWVQAQGQGPR